MLYPLKDVDGHPLFIFVVHGLSSKMYHYRTHPGAGEGSLDACEHLKVQACRSLGVPKDG